MTTWTYSRRLPPRDGGRRGFALVLVLVTVGLAVVLGFGYISSATIRALASSNNTQANRAHYLAEAGINHAMHVLWNDPDVIEASSSSSRLGPYHADETDDTYTFWGYEDASEGMYTLYCQATTGAISQTVSAVVFRSKPYDERMLDEAPEGYWRMGETGGNTVEDSSGHEYDLTAYGNVGWGQPGAITTDTDTGVYLDGVDDYMYRAPTLALKIPDDLTVSLWFKVDEMPTDLAYLFTYSEQGEGPTANAMYEAVLNPSGSITFLMEYGAGHDILHTFGGLGISPGEWHNFAMTRDKLTRNIRVYVDGMLKGSWNYGNPGPPLANSGKNSGLYVGSAYGESNFFKGRMDELAIYDHVMTGQELNSVYQAATGDQAIRVLQWNDSPDLGG